MDAICTTPKAGTAKIASRHNRKINKTMFNVNLF